MIQTMYRTILITRVELDPHQLHGLQITGSATRVSVTSPAIKYYGRQIQRVHTVKATL
jgi:hypothetical protein